MPQMFGRYELHELLGRGGMGEVYRARDTVRERNVALKVLPEHLASDKSFTARFRRESLLAAQLNEPHIIPIHDFGEIDGRLFIDMRLVEGHDLHAILEARGHLPPPVAVDIVGQVAAALDAAHANDLVHRDVKPSNVLLTAMPTDPLLPPFAYLVDFGIARSTQQQLTALTTTSSATIGTLAYMSPERIAGQPGDHRADVYALACVLFETLAGSPPFGGEMFAMMYAHVNTPPPRASALVADVPAGLDEVIAKGMAKAPDDRYASAGELALAAREVLRGAPTRSATEAAEDAPPSAETTTVLARDDIAVGPNRSGPQPTPVLPVVPPVLPPGPPPPPSSSRPEPPAPAGRPRRPRHRRGRLGLAAAAIVAGAVTATLIAVNQGDGSSGHPGGTGDAGRASDSSAKAAPDALATTPRSGVADGGTMTWALLAKVTNYNVYQRDGGDATGVMGPLLPEPFHFDAGGTPSVDTDYFVSIAKTSDDPFTIDYKINPKARWSDGRAVSYQDFAAQADALDGHDDGYDVRAAGGYDQISSVARGANDREVVVEFARPYADWGRLFAPLVPKSLTSSPDAFNHAWADKPLVTAGAFAWGSASASGPSYTVVRDPNWWADKAKLDRITFTVFKNQADAIAAFGTHSVDYAVIGGNNAVSNVAAAKKYPGVDLRATVAGPTYRQLILNVRDPVLSDVAVRRAIVAGIDRGEMATKLNGSLTAESTLLQNHFYLTNQPPYVATCGDYCTSNTARAKSLLEDDGWALTDGYYAKDGRRLSVAITVPADTANAASEAKIAKTSLQAAGIALTVQTVPAGEFTSKYVDAGNFQLAVTTLFGTPFPVSAYQPAYTYDANGSEANPGSGGSKHINALLTRAATATDPTAEARSANAASTAMWSNAAWLPLYERPQETAVTSTLVNIGAFGLADTRYQDVGRRV